MAEEKAEDTPAHDTSPTSWWFRYVARCVRYLDTLPLTPHDVDILLEMSVWQKTSGFPLDLPPPTLAWWRPGMGIGFDPL